MDELERSYRSLDLAPGASAEEVKRAYQELARVWHPDRFERDERLATRAREKTKELNAAYQLVLAALFTGELPHPDRDPASAGKPVELSVPELPASPEDSGSAAPQQVEPVGSPKHVPGESLVWCVLAALLVFAGGVGWLTVRGAAPATAEWEVLFDGSSVAHWRAFLHDGFPDDAWAVDDDALKTLPGAERVDLITREEYTDFELELEWKISPGGNSGIMFHVSEEGRQASDTGPEMQIIDDAGHPDGRLPETSAGSLFALIPPVHKRLQPLGQWNKVRIRVNGRHVEYWLNDLNVVEYDLGTDALNALVARCPAYGGKPGWGKNPTGYIALQYYTGEVWYRHIRVRRLAPAG